MKQFKQPSGRILWNKEAIIALEELLTSGNTLVEIAEAFTCTRQNISLIVKKHLPHLTRQDFGLTKRRSLNKEARLKEIRELYGRETFKWDNDLEQAHADFFRRKRQNCKSKKWEWDISYGDLTYPKFCPVLGIELDWFLEKRAENSPSIDRLDSTKGYIKGNVAVMSWRANRIKNDGTLQEHQMLVDFLFGL